MKPKSRVRKPKHEPVLLAVKGYIHELEDQLEGTIYENRKGVRLLGVPLHVGDTKVGLVYKVDVESGMYYASIMVSAEAKKKEKKNES